MELVYDPCIGNKVEIRGKQKHLSANVHTKWF